MRKKITIRIPVWLKDLLDEWFPEEKADNKRFWKAIYKALSMKSRFVQKYPYFSYFLLKNKRDDEKPGKTIWLDESIWHYLTEVADEKETLLTGNPVYDKILQLIADGILYRILSHPSYKQSLLPAKGYTADDRMPDANDLCPQSPYYRESPLSVMGNKSNTKMLDAFHVIMQAFADHFHNWNIVEPCAGSCTLTLNIDYAYKQYCLNDDDWEKANFFHVLRDCYKNLINTLNGWTIDRETYNDLKAEEQAFRSANPTPNVIYPDTPAKELDVRAAARYFFINVASLRNGSTFNTTLTECNYRLRINQLYSLRDKLEKVQIYNEDLFVFLNRFIKKSNTLFIVDPPYLFSSGYASRMTAGKKEFGLAEHIHLAKLLTGTVDRNNHIIYFCRTTMRPDAGIKDPVERERDRKHKKKYLTNLICTLYHGAKLHFIDVPIDTNVTERIITSFQFPGSKLLDTDGLCLDEIDLPFPGKGAV